MKKLVYPFAAVTILMASAFTVINSQDWKISEDYVIKFTSKDPSGIFKGLKGNILFDENNLSASKLDVTIDVNTINTGNGMMNTHAKSPMWFDAEKYPVISFTSSAITKTEQGYAAKGSLQVHGVTKDFTMPFTFQKNDAGGVFNSSFDINRLDFNINSAEPAHGATSLKLDITVPVSK